MYEWETEYYVYEYEYIYCPSNRGYNLETYFEYFETRHRLGTVKIKYFIKQCLRVYLWTLIYHIIYTRILLRPIYVFLDIAKIRLT